MSNLLAPSGIGIIASFAIYLTVLAVVAFVVGLVESFTARLRISHVPQFIFLMTALSLTTFAVVMFFMHGGV
jgi:formate hydrogenlyase subunit 4